MGRYDFLDTPEELDGFWSEAEAAEADYEPEPEPDYPSVPRKEQEHRPGALERAIEQVDQGEWPEPPF